MLVKYYKIALYLCVIGTVVYTALNYFKAGLFPKVLVRPPPRRRNWLYAGLVVLFLFLCFLVDPAVKSRILAMKSASLDPVFGFFNMFGDGYRLYAGLFVFFIIGKIFRWRKMERLFGLALLSSVILGVVGQVVQNLTLRGRPYVTASAFDFFNYGLVFREHLWGTAAYKSFPSGHAITIFSAAMPFVFSLRRWWWKAVLLAVPVMTGLARIYFNKHWLSDVFMSAVLAALLVRVLWKADQAGLEKESAR